MKQSILIIIIFTIFLLQCQKQDKKNQIKNDPISYKSGVLPPYKERVLEKGIFTFYKISQYNNEHEGVSRSLFTEYYLSSDLSIDKLRVTEDSDHFEVRLMSGESGEYCKYQKYYFFPIQGEQYKFVILYVQFGYQAGIKVIENPDNIQEYGNIIDLKHQFYIYDTNNNKLKAVTTMPDKISLKKQYTNNVDRLLVNYFTKSKIIKLQKEKNHNYEGCLKNKDLKAIYSCISTMLNYGFRDYYIPELLIEYLKKKK